MGAERVDDSGVYSPREDSFLMCDILKNNEDKMKGKCVVDLGTGSGILAVEMAKHAKLVIATDISKNAVRYVKKYMKMKNSDNVFFVVCDLLNGIKKADWVVFNPPYLPTEKPGRIGDHTTDGGTEGCELILRFLRDFKNSNIPAAFLLFSSLSNPRKILTEMKNLGIKFEKVANKKIFFEELYVYLLKK